MPESVHRKHGSLHHVLPVGFFLATCLTQVLVSCDGNGFSDELIESLPSLWTEEQQAKRFSHGLPWTEGIGGEDVDLVGV